MTTATETKHTPPTMQEQPWEPAFSPWRHGGWYTSARYPSGACGCVSNNYTDKKWRIACGSLHGLTFSTRRDAANAERAMTLAMNGVEADKAQLLEACRELVFRFEHMDDPQDVAAIDAARAAIDAATK